MDSDLPGDAATPPATPPASPPAESPAEQTRVAAALAHLAALDQTPLAGHPDIYQQVHAELQGALADIDDA
jgi:hypothetical protein